jgi:hypothetical protein
MKGISIIETSVALVVIAILVSGFGTAVYSTVSNARIATAQNQLELLKKAIVGEPRSVPPGEKSGQRYGYLGDMGGVPSSLPQLETAGSQPNYAVSTLLQLGAGWRGPYVATVVSAGMIDPWGNGIAYSIASGTSALTGATVMATLRSLGPDGQSGTADDRVVEIYKAETHSKIVGFVRDDNTSRTLAGVSVSISYPSSGVIVSSSAVTDNDGLYIFDNIPHGPQALQLGPKLAYQFGMGFTTNAARNSVEFVVENLAKAATNVNSIKLTWTTEPPTDFKELWVGGTKYFDGTAAPGLTISFTAATVGGTGVIQEPFRVDVSGLVLQVPDITIGSVGTGGTLKIEMRDFEEVGNNTNVDMTGVTFVAEFSDGSKTLFSPLRK